MHHSCVKTSLGEVGNMLVVHRQDEEGGVLRGICVAWFHNGVAVITAGFCSWLLGPTGWGGGSGLNNGPRRSGVRILSCLGGGSRWAGRRWGLDWGDATTRLKWVGVGCRQSYTHQQLWKTLITV